MILQAFYHSQKLVYAMTSYGFVFVSNSLRAEKLLH